MPIDGITPSLQQFLQLAATSESNKTIRSTKSGLSSTGLPTWASTNQKTMSDFISALKAEFGSSIAEAASARLATLTESGSKPLKAFMVRDTVDEAIRTTQANLNVRDKFLSGIDPAHSFDVKFESMTQDVRLFPTPLNGETKALFREYLLRDVKALMLHSGEKLSTQDLERRMSSLPAPYAATEISHPGSPVAALPGAAADKMAVAHILNLDSSLAAAAMQKLPQCRMLQPEGELTRATLWQALTGSPMPEGTDNLPSLSFTEALSAAFSEKLAVLLKNDDAVAGVMSCMSNIKLDAAIDIANTGRPLVMDDFISPSACLASCAAKARTGQAERSVAKDICRMGNSNVLGQPAFAGARFHTPEGDVTIPFGREAKETFPFRNSADKANFTSGSPSGYTRHLLDTCRNICERREEQAQSLLSLFNQTPLRAWAAQGGTGAPGTLISNGLNEHMATAYDVSRQADGSIRLDMHSNEAAETAGRGSMTVIIGTDGSMTMESCTLESAENVQEQNLRDIVADMVAAPELSANGKSALCRLVSDSLVLDGLHRQDPGTWPSAVQTRLTEFQQHSGVMASLRTLPQDMDAQAIRTVRNELENSIRSYYRHSFRQMDQDGIFPSYIKDALRHSVSGINGEPLRLIPAGHAAPAALDPQSGLPVEAVRREALREQLMEAIPDRTLRGFASQVACQAGLEGSLTMHLLGVEPDNSTPLWPGYVSTMDLNARSAEGVVNHSYPKHAYTITTDAPIPGRTLDDPMNEDRGIHIRLDITQALELAYSNNKLTADLTRFALIVDIPFHQPPRAEGEPPAFTISTLEYHPA